VLRGRKVLIWPDDDAPGRTYAKKVAATLTKLDCEVSIIDAAQLARTAPGGGTREQTKEGWDAANAITEWPDTSALRRVAFTWVKPFDATDAGPAYVSFGKFEMDDDGLTYESTRGRGDNVEIVVTRVSASLEILGLGRSPDGRGWGKYLLKPCKATPASICAPLAADGLQIVRGQQRQFANYLSGVQTKARVTMVHRTGWHEIEGKDVFVLPGENIGRPRVGRVLLDGTAHGPYEAAGTLAEWRDGVGAMTAAFGRDGWP
jgi:hypothetical protein